MPDHPPTDGTVVVTGASSGIGRELARRLAFEARELVLVARRDERLRDLADELRQTHRGLEVEVHACDLADAAALQALGERLQRRSRPVDVLVNNAGFGHRAWLEEASWPTLEEMIAVNVTAPVHLTQRLVPGMVQRGRGGVLNVSSVLALMWRPGSATYVGTKHFLTGFTESLRAELAGTRVVVTQVCPGPVATEFSSVAGGHSGLGSPDFLRIDASTCAAEALQAFRRGRAVVYPGLLNRVVAWLLQICPRPLLRQVVQAHGRKLRRSLGRAA